MSTLTHNLGLSPISHLSYQLCLNIYSMASLLISVIANLEKSFSAIILFSSVKGFFALKTPFFNPPNDSG